MPLFLNFADHSLCYRPMVECFVQGQVKHFATASFMGSAWITTTPLILYTCTISLTIYTHFYSISGSKGTCNVAIYNWCDSIWTSDTHPLLLLHHILGAILISFQPRWRPSTMLIYGHWKLCTFHSPLSTDALLGIIIGMVYSQAIT